MTTPARITYISASCARTATSGSAPARIRPVIAPGRNTRPSAGGLLDLRRDGRAQRRPHEAARRDRRGHAEREAGLDLAAGDRRPPRRRGSPRPRRPSSSCRRASRRPARGFARRGRRSEAEDDRETDDGDRGVRHHRDGEQPGTCGRSAGDRQRREHDDAHAPRTRTTRAACRDRRSARAPRRRSASAPASGHGDDDRPLEAEALGAREHDASSTKTSDAASALQPITSPSIGAPSSVAVVSVSAASRAA